jgi:quinol monooxygenase YgiN
VDPSTIFELRQYTLHPGRRDELIDIFDTHLVESQEAVGMQVVGQFRDADRPDRFVWLRGFHDMAARREGLAAFYFKSDAWKRHAAAANTTMIDSDDVLLLRPVLLGDRVSRSPATRARPGETPCGPAGVYTATIHHLDGRAAAAHQLWLTDLQPTLEAAGAEVVAVLRTEHTENNFPQLPVRESVEVLVVLTRFESRAAMRESAATKNRLAAFETAPAEHLLLEPTTRSALR